MKAMYWQGTGSAQALAYGEVSIGMKFVQGPQWPYFNNPAFFTANVMYTVTGTYHQPDLPIPPLNRHAAAPVPWDTDGGFPNTTDGQVDYVVFDNDLTAPFGTAGTYIPTTFLANAYRVG